MGDCRDHADDCCWRDPGHCFKWVYHRWHVLDDDCCARDHWIRFVPFSFFFFNSNLADSQGTGGEYPASSISASEAANERSLKSRGPTFILVTNLPLSFGGPFAVIVFLIVYSACQQSHLSTVWRVCFGIGCIWPLAVFYFRIRMLNSVLYRRGAIKKGVPYGLVLRYYWKTLLGTCGAWFLYGALLTYTWI